MNPRPAAGLLVSAVIRRVAAAGGNAAILARGDATSGAILFLCLEKGQNPRFFERGLGPDGASGLRPTGPDTLADDADATDYWRRRRSRDPDLWVVELDIAGAERFAAETMTFG